MLWLRMLFKKKIKVYVLIDENLTPITNSNGLASFRYQKHSNAPLYSTPPSSLSPLDGAVPFNDETALSLEEIQKPQRKQHTAVTSIPDTIPPNTIVIYTDGGASPNPGPAACAFLMMFGPHSLEFWEYLGNATNNIAELTAILRAVEHIKNKNLPILLYSDSNYALDVLSGKKNAAKNKELVAQTRAELAKCPQLHLLKVKAHIGITHNEHVDQLVALARDSKASGERRSKS